MTEAGPVTRGSETPENHHTSHCKYSIHFCKPDFVYEIKSVIRNTLSTVMIKT